MSDATPVTFDASDGRVTIRRDERGIPFVLATGMAGLFEGQGYATACDRLWHIEHDRRRARGTLAAVTGDRAHAQYDAFARRVRFVDLARTGFDAFDGDTRSMCTGLANGINRRLAESPALSSPFQRIGAPRPEPMEPWEPLAIFLARHATFATWQQKLWNARVAAALGVDSLAKFSREARRGATPLIVPPGVAEANGHLLAGFPVDDDADWLVELAPLGLGLSGSNAWAVHGSRSATGAPIVAGDPHRALEAPNVYYQIGLALRDEPVDAAGFSFPGVPGVGHFAQNLTTAWAVTNAMADYQDLFIEHLDDAVVDRRVETVEVRGGAGIVVECLATRHGPIVSDNSASGVGLALASSGFDRPAGSLAAVCAQLRARSVDELDASLAAWVEPVNNFVLADTAGMIAYRTAGTVPVRAPINAWLPVPGWDPAYDWHGSIPDGELPRSLNPDAEAIVTANQRITSTDYPYVLGVHPYAGHRATRIWTRLDAQRAGDVAAMSAVHGDDVSLPAQRFASLAGGELDGWDGRMSSDSVPAAVYTTARHRIADVLASRLPESLLTNPFAAWEPRVTASTPAMWVADAIPAWAEDDDRWLLDRDETWETLLHAAVREAAIAVAGRTWGDLHHLQPLRLGERGRVDLGPVGGATDCVMATNDIAGASLHALTGSTCRYVWDLADRSRSRWVVPMGGDEDDDSPHFLDQRDAFVDAEHHPIWPLAPQEAHA